MSAHDRLRAALQSLLDSDDPDGWLLTHYVIIMGCNKMTADGKVTNTAWMVAPDGQADYITQGLMAAADEMQANAEIEDD